LHFQKKRTKEKDSPAECFNPLSENNENLSKVVPTSRETPLAPLQIFYHFLIHSRPTPPSGLAGTL